MDLKITKRNSHFFYCLTKSVLLCLLVLASYSCSQSPDTKEDVAGENKPETLVKRRDDGTVSSVNQGKCSTGKSIFLLKSPQNWEIPWQGGTAIS